MDHQPINIVHNENPKDPLAQLPHAADAAFNSYAKQDQATCLPDTCVDLLKDIQSWADRLDKPFVSCLFGKAGTGKSTIARTVARMYHDRQRLAASFFFSRCGGDVGHVGKFVTSLAVQLAHNIPASQQYIYDAIAERSDIVSQPLRDQWEHLIYGPLSKLPEPGPFIVVVDALDERDDHSDIDIIMQLLTKTQTLTGARLRVFLTGGPKQQRMHRLSVRPVPRYPVSRYPFSEHGVLWYKIERPTIHHDIELFLKDELQSIRRELGLDAEWPGTEITTQLVQSAGGSFIWAATACRFIRARKLLAPESLKTILRADSSTIADPGEHLDQIYNTVLQSSLYINNEDKEKEEQYYRIRNVLGSIVVLFSPLSARCLSKLLHIMDEDVCKILKDLHAILINPEDPTQPPRLYHASFRDFLLRTDRCGDGRFWVGKKSAHGDLASHCLRLMSGPSGLHQNICGLSGPEVLRSQIDEGTIASGLSPELQYACRHWISHLEQSKQPIVDGDTTQVFLQEHFLHWLEAMSLMRESQRCVPLLSSLRALIAPSNTSFLLRFFLDAKRFVLRYQSILVDAPLQLYYSALVFRPETSLIRQTFEDLVPQRVNMELKREINWGACYSTLNDHTRAVQAVAFSPDGQLVASASDDKTVRLWEAVTGTCRSIFEGHTDYVRAVAFSPDGQLVASASDDKTVQLREAVTGTCRSIFEGHTERVRAVAFSPDGQLVASASDDKTVRLWEAVTGTCHSIFEGHTDWVRAVAFSPNGQLVASGSDDKTVRLWEVVTGTCRSIFEDHTGWVHAVAFSPDGQLVASAYDDKTVRLWEVVTGTCRSIFKGHIELVRAVAFSPDGQLVASASDDKTVRLWEAVTGTCRSIFEGHTERVNAVAFSPEQLVSSGSGDKTVRLWDATTDDSIVMLDTGLEEDSRLPVTELKNSQNYVLQLWKGLLLYFGLIEPHGKHRIRWQCKCGYRGFSDVGELEDDDITALKNHMKQSAGVQFTSSSIVWEVISWVKIRATRLIQSIRTYLQLPIRDGSGRPSRTSDLSQHNQELELEEQSIGYETTQQQRLHVIACMHKNLHEKVLHQENLNGIETDRRLLYLLNSMLKRYRGGLFSYFSLRTVKGVSFTKFHLWREGNVEVRYHDHCCNGSCNCFPPIGFVEPHTGAQYLCERPPPREPSILPDFFLHMIMSPSCVNDDDTSIFKRYPKRTYGRLAITSTVPMEVWGIFYQEGWDITKIVWLYLLLGIFGSFIFGIIWSIYQRDVQGAFGISGWWVTSGGGILAILLLRP